MAPPTAAQPSRASERMAALEAEAEQLRAAAEDAKAEIERLRAQDESKAASAAHDDAPLLLR